MPGCECRSHVLLSYSPEFLHNTFPLLPAAHIPMCYILPEPLPVHARNRLTPVYAGWAWPRWTCKRAKLSLLTPGRDQWDKKHSSLHRRPSQVYASLTSHPVTTILSSKLGYAPVHSVTSNDAWNKPAFWTGCVIAGLGTSSEVVSSENSYWDSDFSVVLSKNLYQYFAIQPYNIFLGSGLLELLILMKLLLYAVFSLLSVLQVRKTTLHQSSTLPSTPMSNTLPPDTQPAFPRENFDPIKSESLIFGCDFWTSGLHKGLPQSWELCSVHTDWLHTAHTAHLSLSRSSGFTVRVQDRWFTWMPWSDMSQKHHIHSTCVDHMCCLTVGPVLPGRSDLLQMSYTAHVQKYLDTAAPAFPLAQPSLQAAS